jgi:eukaryotic-like serine/threonine-protein kinase
MRYTAFISYSHADETWARWLMRRLETYRVPPRLVGGQTAHATIASRLGKFFRDRDELTASSDLSATIRSALADSSALIVICSPAAAASRWVDAEVQAFRDSGRGDRVLAFVVAGDPGQARGDRACFPPSLLAPGEAGQPVEPLAADARREADGRERAFLKLVAGLLGIGFDQLAQREAQRKQRKLLQVAVASLAGMALAIGLAATAYVARNDAQRRQAQAEDILGFMLGDLREKLTTVGRLDLMRSVDHKATAYFASLDPRDLSDRALEEQARSLTGIGQIRLEEGNHPEAVAAFREAHARSTALHEREPGNGQRLFDLAQAEYWIGFVAWQQGRFDDAGVWLRKYRDSASRLAAMDRDNFDWQREVAYGHHNLAVLDSSRGSYDEAEREMRKELSLYREWTKAHPDDTSVRFEAANVASWLGGLMLRQGRLREAGEYFSEENKGHERNIQAEPGNPEWQDRKVASLILLTEVAALQGNQARARANANAAHALATSLTRHDPDNNRWRIALGISRLWQAQLAATKQSAHATASADDAIALLASAHDAEPRNERLLRWLARAHLLQAQLSLARDDIAAADRQISLASGLVEPAWRVAKNEDLRQWLAWSRLLQGDVARARGEEARASQSWEEARTLMEDGDEPIPFARLDPLVRVLVALGREGEAASHRQRLDAAGYVPLQPWPAKAAVADR